MAKSKTVTCRFCKSKIPKDTAYVEEYLTNSGVLRNNYYCSEECLNKKQNEVKKKEWLKEIKKENREKIRSICNLKEKEKNIYFQSTYKSITDNFSQEDIYEFINKYEKDMLDILNNIDFKTVNSRIKYCLSMLENQLQHYLLEKEQPKVEEKKVIVETEIDDFDIVVNVKKKVHRDIDDILGL
jgi:hypothetical protein|nr:MAG TPA: protein of unknown function DUF3330 [Caudoviricetes sp.]